MNLFTLVAELGLDDSKYKKGIGSARDEGKSFASGIVKSVSAGTIALGNLMSAAVQKAGSAVMDFGKKGFDYNRTMEDYVTNFRVLLGGSSDAASKMVGALEDMAAKTPFAMEHLAGSTQTLLSFGVESDRVLPIMSMLGDVAMGNSEKFASLTRAFGQISAAGKLSGEDLNQLIDQGFNPLQTIAQETGASMSDLKAVMAGQKTSREFNNLMKDARREVKKLGDSASDGAKWLVKMAEDGAISAETVEEVFKKVTEEGGLYAGAMEEASKTTSGMISTLGDNWTALLGSVFKPASDFLQSTLLPNAIGAVDALQQGYNEAGFSGMLDALATLATDLGTKITETLTEAGTKITEALPGLIESVTSWASEKKSELLTSAQDLFASFSEAIPEAATAIEAALPGILTAVTAWAIGGKIELASEASTFFAGLSDGLATAISGLSDALPGIVKTITDFAVEQAPVILDQATALFAGLSGAVSTAISNMGTTLPGIVENFATTVTENLPRLLELGGTMVGEIISGIVAAVPDILTAALGFAVTLATEIGKYDWLEIGKNIIDGLLSGIQNAASSSLEAIKQAFVDIWTGVKEVFGINSPSTVAKEAGGFILEGFANGITAGVATFGETIKAAFVGIWEGIKNIFGFGKKSDETEGEASDVGESVVEGLAKGLGDDETAIENAQALATSIIEALKTGFDVTEGVSGAASTIGEAITSGITKGAAEADVSAVDRVATNVYNSLKTKLNIKSGAAGMFKDIGKAIAQGVAKGIKDNESIITAAAREAAIAAYNAALKALDINSPSRKMQEIGAYFAQGFAKGIVDNTREAVSASSAMAQQAMYSSYIGTMSVTQNIAAVPMSENELAMQTANALQMLRFA